MRVKVPLRWLLVGLFLFQIFVAVGLTGWLSFRNGQKAVNDLVTQLQVETGQHVRDKLETYLATPHLINDLNVSAVDLGLLDLDDRKRLEAYLWYQIQNFPHVSYIALVTADRRYAGVSQFHDGSIVLDVLDDNTQGKFEKWRLDDMGRRSEQLQVRENYDPTTRPWYRAAIERGSAVWTDIYNYFGSGQPVISANQPFYDDRGNLVGVASTDLTLWDVSQFLELEREAAIGQVFAIDRQGREIASSVPQPERLQPGLQRIFDSRDPLTRAAALALDRHTKHFAKLDEPVRLSFNAEGERVFLYAMPLTDPRGLDWSIVVLMPESAFMEQIVANTRVTVLLCGVALLTATGLGLFVTRIVARPLVRLSHASQLISRSASPPHPNCHQIRVACNTPIQVAELVVLANSFNQMAVQLHETFTAWEETNQTLERRVRDRTSSLTRAEAQLRALFAAMTEFVCVKDANGQYLKVASTHPVPPYNSAENLEGKTDWELFPPQQAGQFVAYVREALQTRETVRVEYCLTHDGETVWFAASITPIRLNGIEEIAETAIWVARDITARKRAEETIREKEQYLRLILDNIPQQVFWKDTDLVFRGCNTNWASAAGLDSPEEVAGKTDFDLLPDRAIAERFREQDRQIIESQQPELHIIAKKQKPSPEGHPIWLDINKIPIQDKDGNPIGILGVLEDITARKIAEEALEIERKKSEKLLLNILPKVIVEQLKQSSGTVAEQFENATILFADIVGFTSLASRLTPLELVNLLNQIFSKFDRLAQKYELEKIKTIGDAYMIAGGLPVPNGDRAEAIANMALEMQQAICTLQTDWGEPFQIRIGINSGPVVAGVIGIQKFSYDLWGDTVNVASRMESSGEPGKIQVTAMTYELLKEKYIFEERGVIAIKGKGNMKTYWLIDRRS
ncbi:MAG: PAS domain-containing protein [Cyanobacteria bacterium SID2]|nr:PAS domain-containing protein [Cyanobacteria bacterium SID2]